MEYLFLTPEWFFAYSIIFELFFTVTTLLISFYAFKVYRLTDQREAKLFSVAFFSIAISYIVQIILNIIIMGKFEENVVSWINLQSIFLLQLFGLYAHALFYIIGLTILSYITLKIHNHRIFMLLVVLILVSVFFSINKLFMFYLLSSILLLFTVMYYFVRYIQKRKANTLLVLISMIFLLLGTIHVMFSVNNGIYYVIGNILEFVAYLVLLINMLIIFQHGKKKR
jgi:hypothetical protein